MTITVRSYATELVKLLTLPSTWALTAVAALLPPLAAAMFTASVRQAILQGNPELADGTRPLVVGLEWVFLPLICLLSLGVLTGSGEWMSGQGKTSFLAVQSVFRVFGTKGAALLTLTVPVACLTVPATSLVSQLLLGDLSATRSGVPQELIQLWIWNSVDLVVMTAIGFACGVAFRQTVIPLFTLICLEFGIIALLNFLPGANLLPQALSLMLTDPALLKTAHPDAVLTDPVAAGLLLVWPVALLIVATLSLRRKRVP